MKITIAAEIFPPDIGGPATYSEKLARELVRLGHQVSVICYSTKAEAGNYPHKLIRIERGQNTFFRYGRYLVELFRLAWSADVVYTQGPVSSGLPALIVAKIINVKFVVKVVGDYAWEQAMNLGYTEKLIDEFQKESRSGGTGKIHWLKKIESWVCKNADRVIVPSAYLKKIVLGWGVPEGNIEVIFNAVDADLEFDSEASESNSDSKNTILSIGRLVPWKGFELLIDLMSELLAINPNFKLVILGSGPLQKVLQAKVEKLGIADKVEIKKVDAKTRDVYLKTAKMFVLNTGYEGLSHTILEAMQAGTPVITTNVGGNPEVVEHEKTGLLVEYNNKEQLKAAILKLYEDKELREKLAENAKKELEKFSFEKMINKTLLVLRR